MCCSAKSFYVIDKLLPFLQWSQSLAPFWTNALHWLDEGRQGVVGVSPQHAFNVLSKSGLKCEKTGFREDLSVCVCTAYSSDHAQEIQNFVAEGGGLLIGGHAWYWAQTHSGQNALTDFPGMIIYNQTAVITHAKCGRKADRQNMKLAFFFHYEAVSLFAS